MILARQHWHVVCDKLELLFQASFGKPIQPRYLNWRYFDNGREDLLFNVEIAEGVPVASYSAFPVELTRDGAAYRTMLSMTTMTHPGWRGRGLFPKLAAELYVHAATVGIETVWGFPNANSHPVFNSKLGWADIYEIPTMALDLAEVEAHGFALHGSVETDDGFALQYPEMPRDGLIRVDRSKEYLTWRYAKNPANRYKNYVIATGNNVSSYVVTKRYATGLDLVDIQAPDPEEARVLISHVSRLAHNEGIRELYCWAPTHHRLHAVLERLGFRNSAPVTYFGGRELADSAAPNGYLDYRSWYIQMGDSDVY